MEDTFELPVIHRGKQLFFEGRLVQYGYSHRIEVDINGAKVSFEPDEERKYRASIDPAALDRSKPADIELIGIVAAALESLRSK